MERERETDRESVARRLSSIISGGHSVNLRLFVCDPLAKRERSVCHREWHHLVEPSCIMSKLQNLWGGRAAPLASEPRAAAGVSGLSSVARVHPIVRRARSELL